MAERSGAIRSRIVEEIGKLAFSTISDVLEIKDCHLAVKDHAELTEDQLAAVQSVEEVINEKGFRTLRIRQHDKLAALSLLAKILGMLTNKTEISGRTARQFRSTSTPATPVPGSRASSPRLRVAARQSYRRPCR